MKIELNEFLQRKKDFEKIFKEYISDKSIPLKERWDLFIKSDLGKTEMGEFPGVDWDKVTYFDDFYMDRYATSDVKSLLKTAQENNLFEEGGEIKFKEYCLKNFIKAFENDW